MQVLGGCYVVVVLGVFVLRFTLFEFMVVWVVGVGLVWGVAVWWFVF